MKDLDKLIRQEALIELAPNPYLAFGMKLGRDECFAALSSAFWTVVAKLLLSFFSGSIAPHVQLLIMVVVGPVAEKPALLSSYIHDAWKDYRAAAPDERKPIRHYIRRVFKEGWPTLRADLLYHDPSYSILLWLLLHASPGAGAITVALFSGISFVAAVALASTAEVLFVEGAYRRCHQGLSRSGFVSKTYYEARFWVDSSGDSALEPAAMLDHLQQEFCLGNRNTYTYQDRYLTELSLAVYNGRRPYLRFREKVSVDGAVSRKSLQVMYSRAKEIHDKSLDLYRCFVTQKHKLVYEFEPNQPLPQTIDEISDARIRKMVRRFLSGPNQQKFFFSRDVATNQSDRVISIDHSIGAAQGSGAYQIEVKSHVGGLVKSF